MQNPGKFSSGFFLEDLVLSLCNPTLTVFGLFFGNLSPLQGLITPKIDQKKNANDTFRKRKQKKATFLDSEICRIPILEGIYN
jgi:hypothetical protein